MVTNAASEEAGITTGNGSHEKLASIERALPALSDIGDQEVADALVQVAAIQARTMALQQGLVGRLVILRAAQSPGREDDRFLRVDEAASILGHSRPWLYRNWKRFPFATREGKHLLFSKKGMAEHMRRRLQARRSA
jgi:predicted DNA-binding transcriptional regulator AlpA